MKKEIGGAKGDAVFQCQLNRSFQVYFAANESCWSLYTPFHSSLPFQHLDQSSFILF